MRELQNPECVMAVRAGLGSIIPLQLLTMLTPLEMELRTCGLPFINLEFLKVCFRFRCPRAEPSGDPAGPDESPRFFLRPGPRSLPVELGNPTAPENSLGGTS